MDVKFLRTLLIAFSALVAVFAFLILVNYLGSLSGTPADVPGQEEGGGKLPVSDELAQQAMTAARYGGGPRASMIPSSRQGLSTAAVNSQGAIMMVRDKNFGGVAEPPKDMMSILSELGGGDKKKPAPIRLKESDLDGEIKQLGGGPDKEPRLKGAAMPEMGRGAGQEGVTLFTAPVDYKIFKSSETWWAFANSHKCRSEVVIANDGSKPYSPLSNPDFSRESVLVLVSMSDLPNGIFRITKLDRLGSGLAVMYKVDPMAMSAGSGGHDVYSAGVIFKANSVKLIQVP